MKYIVVWSFPKQTNLKENATFNRYYLNSCKNRYGSHHWEDLKASFSTKRIKKGMYHLAFCILLKTMFGDSSVSPSLNELLTWEKKYIND